MIAFFGNNVNGTPYIEKHLEILASTVSALQEMAVQNGLVFKCFETEYDRATNMAKVRAYLTTDQQTEISVVWCGQDQFAGFFIRITRNEHEFVSEYRRNANNIPSAEEIFDIYAHRVAAIMDV